ncbi:unnamed protein product [Darwinula stevensoni]|uniref:Peptidase S1 domain-containing protein n=1 Tax=Darwinula stevensoni TaxID=69355 RepID=A0A7R8XCZ1_9CRUS|nr:unnamed protein product [Darwinula stevensoni]CAG0892995.1 unnamed protein product [Darwinula stevensoni]
MGIRVCSAFLVLLCCASVQSSAGSGSEDAGSGSFPVGVPGSACTRVGRFHQVSHDYPVLKENCCCREAPETSVWKESPAPAGPVSASRQHELSGQLPVLAQLQLDVHREFPSFGFIECHCDCCKVPRQCSSDLMLQCADFQLPDTPLCWQSAFLYGDKRACGTSNPFKNPVNMGKSFTAILYASLASGPGFDCTVTCAQGSTPSCKCGIPTSPPPGGKRSVDLRKNATDPNLDRIWGGLPVPYEGKYPWMAHFQDKGEFCGGSLINDRYVLTAAQCVDQSPSDTFYVTLGDLDWSSQSESQSLRLPARAIIHPQYDSVSKVNDVALLKLNSSVDFQAFPRIRPICISANALPIPGQTGRIAGWGYDGGPGISTVMKESTATIMTEANCKNYQGTLVNGNNFCANAAGRNFCNGDVGGPFMFETEAGYYQQLGIISSPTKDCYSGFGGVYIKTASEWMQNRVETEVGVHLLSDVYLQQRGRGKVETSGFKRLEGYKRKLGFPIFVQSSIRIRRWSSASSSQRAPACEHLHFLALATPHSLTLKIVLSDPAWRQRGRGKVESSGSRRLEGYKRKLGFPIFVQSFIRSRRWSSASSSQRAPALSLSSVKHKRHTEPVAKIARDFQEMKGCRSSEVDELRLE